MTKNRQKKTPAFAGVSYLVLADNDIEAGFEKAVDVVNVNSITTLFEFVTDKVNGFDFPVTAFTLFIECVSCRREIHVEFTGADVALLYGFAIRRIVQGMFTAIMGKVCEDFKMFHGGYFLSAFRR